MYVKSHIYKCARRSVISITVCVSIAIVVPDAQAQWQDCTCGGEGETICLPWDDPVCYFNNAILPDLYSVAANDGCDRGLSPGFPYFCGCLVMGKLPEFCGCSVKVWGKCIIPKICWVDACFIPNLCVDCQTSSREQNAASHFSGTWTHRKMKEQRMLANDEPINWVTRIAGHNAYNNSADNYQIPNQTYSITDQLHGGARVIMLDIHGDPGTNGIELDGNLRLSHAGADCVGCNPLDRPAVYVFKEIGEWIADHPDEIVIVEVEDYDIDSSNYKELTGPIEKYLGPWLLRKSEKLANRWPTRREMLDNDRRVVVFSQSYNDHDVLFNGGWGGPYKYSLSGAKANEFDGTMCDRFRTLTPGDAINTQAFSEVWEDRSFIGSLEPAGVICHTGSTACENPPVINDALNALLGFLGIGLHLESLCCDDPSQSIPMRELVECNTGIIGIDRYLDVEGVIEPQRLKEVIWSWQYGYNAPNGHAAILTGPETRWLSAPQNEEHHFACAKFREGDSSFWEDPVGLEWRITTATGTWDQGFLACIVEYGADGFTFGVPIYAYQQLKFVEARNVATLTQGVWLGYRDTTGAGQWEIDDGYDPDIITSARGVREGTWVRFEPKSDLLQNCPATREFIWDFGEGPLVNAGSNPVTRYYYRDERDFAASLEFPVTVTEHYPGGECEDRTLEVFVFVFNASPAAYPTVAEPIINVGETVDFRAGFFDPGVTDTHLSTIDWGDLQTTENIISSTSVNEPITFVEGATPPGTTGSYDRSHTYGVSGCGQGSIGFSTTDHDGGVGGSSLRVDVLDVNPVLEFPSNVYTLYNPVDLIDELTLVDIGVPTIIEDTICFAIQFVDDAPIDGFPLGLSVVTWTAQLSEDGENCADESVYCETVAFSSQIVYVSECLDPGDVDFNCVINRCDLISIKDRIGEDADGPTDPADLDRDGLITNADVEYLINNELCDQVDCGDCGCNRWVQTGDSPDQLYNAAMVHDVYRSETVLFGGYTSDGVTTLERNDTWVLDTDGWHRVPLGSSGGISDRSSHAMAYDLARGVIVTATGGPTIGDGDNTWEWNGGRWTGRSDDTYDFHPSSRLGSAMAYDIKLRQTVLFGGNRVDGLTNETWIWRNFEWRLRTPHTSPSARSEHAMAYDTTYNTMIMFGGRIDSSIDLGDTWSWDGNQWTLLSETGPSPRYGMAMAYDPNRQAMILHGGNGPGEAETWAWDGQAWTLVTATGPKAPFGHTLTYDSARRRVVLFVPARIVIENGPGVDVGETWILDADVWVKIASTPPVDRGEEAMVYVSSHEQSLLLGASETGAWVYADGMWTASPSRGGPNERIRHAMAYDKARDQVVLFGGNNCCTGFDDTWLWDPALRTWSQAQSLFPRPLERSRHAMAYDSRRQVVVMFGGEPCSSCGSGSNPGPETWEWNGSSWRLTHDTAPPRSQHAMVYDPVDDVVLLYGGWPTDRETWAYSVNESGVASWTQRFPVYSTSNPPPPGLTGHSMVYDNERGTVLMFGGGSNANFNGTADSWLWNRANQRWQPLETTNDPPSRKNFGMAYDQARKASVIFGGGGGMRDTWELTSGFPESISTPSSVMITGLGQRLELSVATDGLGPFNYRWFRDGVLVEDTACGQISGASTNTLVIDPAIAEDAGLYTVWVNNSCNATTPLSTPSVEVIVDVAAPDCNRNGRDDTVDILCGGYYICEGFTGSFDCDENGLPDECQPVSDRFERLEDFESGADVPYTLNGSAILDPITNTARLTENVRGQMGSVVFDVLSRNPVLSFEASFHFIMGPFVLGPFVLDGADGISFALLDANTHNNTALFGEEGPEDDSLVVKFDIYFNGVPELPSGNFVELKHNGNTLVRVDLPFVMENAGWHFAEINFDGQNLTMVVTPNGGSPITIFDAVEVPGFTPFVSRYGFGARTGALFHEQRVDNVFFSGTSFAVDCTNANAPYLCDVIMGDINGDGVVGFDDHAALTNCMEGVGLLPAPVKPLTPTTCLNVFDFDNDGDVDLKDAAAFQQRFGSQ